MVMPPFDVQAFQQAMRVAAISSLTSRDDARAFRLIKQLYASEPLLHPARDELPLDHKPRSPRGRKVDSTLIPLHEVRERYHKAYHTVLQEPGREFPPTVLQTAMEMGITERTLYRYMDRLELPFPPD